jgi:hypothetical protein
MVETPVPGLVAMAVMVGTGQEAGKVEMGAMGVGYLSLVHRWCKTVASEAMKPEMVETTWNSALVEMLVLEVLDLQMELTE